MLRRYRLYAKRPDGRLTTDRLKYEQAPTSTKMEFVIRASSMWGARQAVKERDWAGGTGEPGLLRVRKGLHGGQVEFAPYLREKLES